MSIQSDASLLSMAAIVDDNLSRLDEREPAALQLRLNGRELSYYGKAVSISTTSSKRNRKLKKAIEEEMAAGRLPPGAGEVIVEWGPLDGPRDRFLMVEHEGKRNFINVKLKGPRAKKGKGPGREQVFVTGTCLFGKHGVRATTDRGDTLHLCSPSEMRNATAQTHGVIEDLDFMDGLHGYEVQSTLLRQGALSWCGSEQVFFNAPFIPYVLYGRGALERGLLTRRTFLDYVDRLAARVQDIIDYERGVAECEVVPLDPLYPFLDDLLDTDRSLEDFVRRLVTHDPWWGAYLGDDTVEDFESLGFASYVKVYHDLLSAPGDIDLWAVEMQEEMRIMKIAYAAMRDGKLSIPKGNNRTLGLYPFVQVVSPNAEGQCNMAFYSEEYGRRDLAREILERATRSVPKAIVRDAQSTLIDLERRRSSGAQTHAEAAEPLRARLPFSHAARAAI